MAHLQKFKACDIKRLANEYDRVYDDKSKYKNDVDLSRTKNNYQISQNGEVQNSEEFTKAVEERLSKLEYRKTKATVGLCTWVVTCPEELKGNPETEKEFFMMCYEYAMRRYGVENVMNGYVHNDETTPHIHIPVIPCVRVNETEKLNAKLFMPKKELKDFQVGLEDICSKQFGIKGLVLNGRTKGNYTISELKERTAKEKELSSREQNISSREQEVTEKENNINNETEYNMSWSRSLHKWETELKSDKAIIEQQKQAFALQQQQAIQDINARENALKMQMRAFEEYKEEEEHKIQTEWNDINEIRGIIKSEVEELEKREHNVTTREQAVRIAESLQNTPTVKAETGGKTGGKTSRYDAAINGKF